MVIYQQMHFVPVLIFKIYIKTYINPLPANVENMVSSE